MQLGGFRHLAAVQVTQRLTAGAREAAEAKSRQLSRCACMWRVLTCTA